MAINNAKHLIGEIDGVRCTIIETGASAERTAFLTDLLSYNNLEVKTQQEQLKDPAAEPTFTIAVADVVFNPVFAIYERSLKTPEGYFVTPAYWRQECTDCDPRYWLRKKGRKA